MNNTTGMSNEKAAIISSSASYQQVKTQAQYWTYFKCLGAVDHLLFRLYGTILCHPTKTPQKNWLLFPSQIDIIFLENIERPHGTASALTLTDLRR